MAETNGGDCVKRFWLAKIDFAHEPAKFGGTAAKSPMPKFFFALSDGGSRFINTRGENLPSVALARERALRLANEVSRPLDNRWSVQLTDHKLQPVMSISIPADDPKRVPYLAGTDKLTAASDRYGFVDRLNEFRGQSPGQKVLLLKTDICDFHEVNISYGYEAGDALLVETAARLSSVPRAVVGRLGGNEFAVFAAVEDGTTGTELVEKISSCLSSAFVMADVTIQVRFAIGYAFSDADMDTMTLLRRAGAALAGSKADTLVRATAFDEATALQIRRRFRLTGDLQQAVNRQEFSLHYQPKVDLITRKITDAEALIRWHHPVRGMQSPAEFIPVAEKTGMIVEIDKWVAYSAFVFATQVNKGRQSPIGLSVNISAVHLQRPNFVELVKASIERTEVDPNWITLELTESAFADTAPDTIQKLRQLRDLGIGLALDDFGKGYSSLQNLAAFPLTEIKIDQSFVRGMAGSAVKRAIVAAVINIGKELQSRVTAEGIETKEELQLLQDLGCLSGQGYLFSKPLAEPDFLSFLGSHHSAITPSEPGTLAS